MTTAAYLVIGAMLILSASCIVVTMVLYIRFRIKEEKNGQRTTEKTRKRT